LITITDKPIDVDKLLDYVSDQSSGASVLFTGTVRDHNEQDKVSELHYEAYQEMAEKIISFICKTVISLSTSIFISFEFIACLIDANNLIDNDCFTSSLYI